jgi:hypothetical protein
VAQEASLSFNDILQSYVIERFLARLSRSPQADPVLLKGALMLRVWGVSRARPTMDIDLLRRGVADQAALVRLVEECAAIGDPSDGVIFEPTTISVEPIRDATKYVGTRVRLHARFEGGEDACFSRGPWPGLRIHGDVPYVPERPKAVELSCDFLFPKQEPRPKP